MGEPRLMREAALYLLGALLPRYIDHRQSGDYIEAITPSDYMALSVENRAVYDLAQELWNGSGPLARFVLCADGHRARAGICAVSVAFGPITLDMA